MNKGLQRCLLASMRGFEPPTPRLGVKCYTNVVTGVANKI